MPRAVAYRIENVADASTRLFERIGEFLADNGLTPDPLHYAFAYRVLTDVNGPLAKAVERITDGGVRLSRRDIENLGGEIGALAPPTPSERETRDRNEKLMAQTQMQVEGFADMVTAMRAETVDFGRNLARSTEEMAQRDGNLPVADMVEMARRMLERVRSAERRLEAATSEAQELRAKLEEARDNARRDPLTDLPNRRAFEESFAASSIKGTPMCIAVCDVDRFKRVNDDFGHSVGDRVLKAIGEALLSECEGHLVCRYGGEEFAVLFYDLDAQAAHKLLDATREKVAAKRYRLRETDAPLGAVTFSAGLTVVQPDESLEAVFARADSFLYAAKAAGRNRLIVG